MTCINHHLQLSRGKAMRDDVKKLRTQLATREISIGEFQKKVEQIKTGINDLMTYFDIYESEEYKLPAILRERLNLRMVEKFERGYAKGTDWDKTLFYLDIYGCRVPQPREIKKVRMSVYQPRVVKINGRYLFFKKDGTELNDEEYDDAHIFTNGRAAVCVGNKWHFIKENGEKLNDKTYSNVRSFLDGRAAVKIGNKWHFITEDGSTLPGEGYDATHGFIDGRADVIQNGNKYCIDINGNKIERKW